MTPHPGTIVQCALPSCGTFFTPHVYSPGQKYCQKACQLTAADRKRRTNRKANPVARALPEHGCPQCGKGFVGRPPAGTQDRYCSEACTRAATAMDRRRGDVPRKDPYTAVCCHCGRVAGDLMLSDTQLRALRPLPRCEHCGGPVWVEPLPVAAHRTGDVPAGHTYRATSGWAYYHESVGDVTA